MKRVVLGLLGAAGAALWTIAACAQSEAENHTQLPPRLIAAPQVALQRPGMFAAASVSSARRMTPEQRDEWRFLKDATAAVRFETEASKLALSKSSNPAVLTTATSVIEHHEPLQGTLYHMLHVRSMAAPMLANDQRKTLNHLTKLQGKKFDREYVAQVALRSQRETVSTFERAALAVQEPGLKTWIEATLPTLRSELASAEGIATRGESTRLAGPARESRPASKITARSTP